MALPPLSVLPVGEGASVAACATVIVTVGVGVEHLSHGEAYGLPGQA